MKIKYPEVEYPTIVDGVVYGPVRCESLDGSEMYLETPDEVTVFKNFKPFEMNGKMWGVTHLQKKSPRGWLRTSPDCWHWWRFWKMQKQDSSGNWIPGTERGIYIRKPGINLFGKQIITSWRWDVKGTVLDGKLRHWIPTKGIIAGHWD